MKLKVNKRAAVVLSIGAILIGLSTTMVLAADQTKDQQSGEYPGFAKVPMFEGGPPWKLHELEALVPADAPEFKLEKGKPVPAGASADSLLKAAFQLLHAGDKESLANAFRLAGVASNKNADQNAIRLLSLMLYNGIGTTRDKSGALRNIVKLVDKNDIDAMTYLADNQPKMFVDECKSYKTTRLVSSAPVGSALKISGAISDKGKYDAFKLEGDTMLDVISKKSISNYQPNRMIDIAGYMNKEGKLVALAAEVPKPTFNCSARMDSGGIIAGKHQVHSVHVTITNSGRQIVRDVKINVRIYDSSNTKNERNTETVIESLKPGQKISRQVDVSIYNFQYIAGTSIPKVEVNVEDYDW